jgi:hypothetical protein
MDMVLIGRYRSRVFFGFLADKNENANFFFLQYLMFILFPETKKEDRSDSVLVGLGFITSLYFTTACNETDCFLKNQQITFILANNFSLFRNNLGTQSLSTEEKQFHPY